MGPVDGNGQLSGICASVRINIHRSCRVFSRRLLLYGCQLITIFLQHLSMPWSLQKILLWILAQWTVCRITLNSYTQRFRRLMAIFQTVHLPSEFSWEWWNQENVICVFIMTRVFSTLAALRRTFSFENSPECGSIDNWYLVILDILNLL